MLPKEEIIKKLISASRCGSCGHNYEVNNIDVLGHNKEIWFLRIHCSECNHKSLVAAVVKGKNINMHNDLSPAEVEKFKKAPAISADDVLDMHNFLKTYNDSLSAIIGK